MSEATDRELLELAARIAGITEELQQLLESGMHGTRWNPLADDGDALRLLDAIQANVSYCPDFVTASLTDGPFVREYFYERSTEKSVSLRYAITRLAAFIEQAKS